jgi:hypothetical protein
MAFLQENSELALRHDPRKIIEHFFTVQIVAHVGDCLQVVHVLSIEMLESCCNDIRQGNS